jgi:phosphatidylserine/phosphatidylglycerophosphate/cardiolipin synthase-like enzyme
VVEHAGLARTFERYLANDLAIAAQHNDPPEAVGTPLPAPPLPTTKTPVFQTFFPAKQITRKMTLTPLLTPDPGVYTAAVVALIGSAATSLYLQFQYIELPRQVDATSQPFVALVDAVIARQKAGVDVKIIMSEYETQGYLEQLQARGVNVVANVKTQNNVHNKGIIVDTKSVLISSQNWSTDGTLYNRDAGIIIEDPEVAKYYEQIFLHDWDHLAH